MTPRAKLSVVVPVFNEAQGLERTFGELRRVLTPLDCDHEIVFINDGSRDATPGILDRIAASAEAVEVAHLSRNFGKEAALAAGLELASGDCIVFVDADLQHPPDMIPVMLEKWRAGADVVNARKLARGRESITHRLFAAVFNWSMSKALGRDFSGASDYKLIDRQVAEALKRCPERNRFFRGLVTWIGFRCEDVAFDVQERRDGETKWSFSRLLRYSASNLLAFSSLPLEIVAYAGFVTVALGMILLLQTAYNYFSGEAAVGFTTVIAVQIMLGGMVLASLGVIALYIAKMYQEQKGRPLFIIRRSSASRRGPPP